MSLPYIMGSRSGSVTKSRTGARHVFFVSNALENPSAGRSKGAVAGARFTPVSSTAARNPHASDCCNAGHGTAGQIVLTEENEAVIAETDL